VLLVSGLKTSVDGVPLPEFWPFSAPKTGDISIPVNTMFIVCFCSAMSDRNCTADATIGGDVRGTIQQTLRFSPVVPNTSHDQTHILLAGGCGHTFESIDGCSKQNFLKWRAMLWCNWPSVASLRVNAAFRVMPASKHFITQCCTIHSSMGFFASVRAPCHRLIELLICSFVFRVGQCFVLSRRCTVQLCNQCHCRCVAVRDVKNAIRIYIYG
jgi:hypothetical protein